mmetsp:Transcript_9773/g.17881  ORF Transcript_9773/g.17881 Transcript_9773/m.17881 type:complete len:201 (-) Transcript_9773:104-706(-)
MTRRWKKTFNKESLCFFLFTILSLFSLHLRLAISQFTPRCFPSQRSANSSFFVINIPHTRRLNHTKKLCLRFSAFLYLFQSTLSNVIHPSKSVTHLPKDPITRILIRRIFPPPRLELVRVKLPRVTLRNVRHRIVRRPESVIQLLTPSLLVHIGSVDQPLAGIGVQPTLLTRGPYLDPDVVGEVEDVSGVEAEGAAIGAE